MGPDVQNQQMSFARTGFAYHVTIFAKDLSDLVKLLPVIVLSFYYQIILQV